MWSFDRQTPPEDDRDIVLERKGGRDWVPVSPFERGIWKCVRAASPSSEAIDDGETWILPLRSETAELSGSVTSSWLSGPLVWP